MRISLIAAASLVALTAAACSSASHATTADSSSSAPQGLAKASTLSVCIDPEYAPLEYYANGSSGTIVGFDADVSRAIADRWKVKANLVPTAFDGLMPALQSKRCDVLLSGLYMSEKRLAVADAVPTLNTGPVIVTSPDSASSFTKPTDLCGVDIAAQSASANAAIIQGLSKPCAAAGKPAPHLTQYPQTAQTVLAVLNGKSKALIETDVAAAHMARQNQGKLVVVDGIFPKDTKFGAFTRKGDVLSKSVAEAMTALRADGTLRTLATKYGLNPTTVSAS
jgi:polar amino acid transport system substrate-binding protein